MMSCFSKFKNDRTCELCAKIETSYWCDCKAKTEEKNNMFDKLKKIQRNCEHFTTGYEDYHPYDRCKLGSKREDTDGCIPKLECEKYRRS